MPKWPHQRLLPMVGRVRNGPVRAGGVLAVDGLTTRQETIPGDPGGPHVIKGPQSQKWGVLEAGKREKPWAPRGTSHLVHTGRARGRALIDGALGNPEISADLLPQQKKLRQLGTAHPPAMAGCGEGAVVGWLRVSLCQCGPTVRVPGGLSDPGQRGINALRPEGRVLLAVLICVTVHRGAHLPSLHREPTQRSLQPVREGQPQHLL